MGPRFVLAVAVVVGALAAGAHLSVLRAQSSADFIAPPTWTMFRRVPSGNAVLPGTLRVRWSVETQGAISSSPTVVGDTLYIDNNSGWLSAIGVRDGRVRWRYKANNALMSAPIVVGDVVIVGEGNENSTTYVPRRRVQVGSGENALIAVNAADGNKRWSVSLHGSGMPTPAIVDGVLVHHDGAGDVVGVDPATGRVLYVRHLGAVASMVGALPTGDGAFVTTGLFPNGVWKLRASDGATIWRASISDAESGVGDCPPVSDGVRIFCDDVGPAKRGEVAGVGVQGQGRAYALDSATGAWRWNVGLETGDIPPRNEAAIPLYDNGTVFLGSAIAPYMHALDAASGALRWRTKVQGPVLGGIVATDGVLYFGDLQGYLWALDEASGKVLGSKKIGTPFNVGSPIVVGRTLVIGSTTGRVTALPLDDIRSAHDAPNAPAPSAGSP
jgi:outer membrane protein assembly factor BamB